MDALQAGALAAAFVVSAVLSLGAAARHYGGRP